MRRLFISMSLMFIATTSSAQTNEVNILDGLKSEACNGNKNCESMFISAISMTSNISRYHGECITSNGDPKLCRNAKIFYDHVASEYEKDKATRQ